MSSAYPIQTLAMTAVNNAVVFGTSASGSQSPFYSPAENGVARVQVSGAFTGSAIFEETLDNLNWFASPYAFADIAPLAGVPIITSPGGTYVVKMPGSVGLRVRCTSAGTGSALILVAIVEGSDVPLSPFANAAVFTGVLNFPVSSTVNQSSVPASTSSVLLIAANPNRAAMGIVNDSVSATLYISLSGAASLTNYEERAGPGAAWAPRINFRGAVNGLWTAAVGNARIAEYV